MDLLEILSPAGSMEGLKAAINAGGDALYIGGTSFGARASANNLQEDDMLYAIDYAHIHGKSLYLTVNTLLKEEEVKDQLYEYLYRYYKHGIDAAIVQDLGVLHFIHEHFPNLPLHASTQMTLTMSQGANELKQYGVNRLVTSRELSLSEIRAIRDNTDLEIETFVHGALCYSFSGQCLMSSMIGGRSGNRGRCAQTCRMQYKVKDDGKVISDEEHSYVLSPKDQCTIDLIPEMVEAGINSFKIEGRMKRPEYASGVTYAYRKYLDYYLEYGKEKFKEFANEKNPEYRKDLMMLKDLYNRGGFSSGYFNHHNGKSMMSMDRPNHTGIYIGEVKSVKGIRAQIALETDVNAQDVVEFRDGNQALYEFTVKDDTKKGMILETNFMKGSGIRPGNKVYRTRNNSMLAMIQGKYGLKECKEEIDAYFNANKGYPMLLTYVYKDISITVTGDVVDEAKNQPTTVDKVEKQLNKINDTPFSYRHLEVAMDEDVFLPVGKLNELRRDAVEQLIVAVTNTYRREEPIRTVDEKDSCCSSNSCCGCAYDSNSGTTNSFDTADSFETTNSTGIDLVVCVKDIKQLPVVCSYEECDRVYVDMNCIEFDEINKTVQYINEHHMKSYLLLPHIFRKDTADLFKKHVDELVNNDLTGYVLRSLEEYGFMKELLQEASKESDKLEEKELVLDYHVYVMNKEAQKFWREKGITRYTTSVELNYNEMKKVGCESSDILVYGRIPVMVSAQCVIKNVGKGCELGKRDGSNETTLRDGTKKYELVDRFNKSFFVRNHCKFCYNSIYNSDCISLLSNADEIFELNPKGIRLDFTFEDERKVREVMEEYIHAFKLKDYSYETKREDKNVTRGHFKRGIL